MNGPWNAERAQRATEAFNLHRTLLLAWRDDPILRRDPRWLLRHYDAYEALNNACESYEARDAVGAEPIA